MYLSLISRICGSGNVIQILKLCGPAPVPSNRAVLAGKNSLWGMTRNTQVTFLLVYGGKMRSVLPASQINHFVILLIRPWKYYVLLPVFYYSCKSV